MIELYPTISVEKAENMDLSTMHFMNHVTGFGWGSVRILNLYATVFVGKPSASMLKKDVENIAYIEEVLESIRGSSVEVVIAWGSS